MAKKITITKKVVAKKPPVKATITKKIVTKGPKVPKTAIAVKKVPSKIARAIADSLTISGSRKEGSAQSLSKFGLNNTDKLKSAKADKTKANLIYDRLEKAGSNSESYYSKLYKRNK